MITKIVLMKFLKHQVVMAQFEKKNFIDIFICKLLLLVFTTRVNTIIFILFWRNKCIFIASFTIYEQTGISLCLINSRHRKIYGDSGGCRLMCRNKEINQSIFIYENVFWFKKMYNYFFFMWSRWNLSFCTAVKPIILSKN